MIQRVLTLFIEGKSTTNQRICRESVKWQR